MIRRVRITWALAAVAMTVPLALSGCSDKQSAAEASASASPSATAKVMEVEQGTDEINVAVGQSVDFQTTGPALWSVASSDETVFQAIQPTEDVFTPNTPGGVAAAPGVATVTMTLPSNGAQWAVKVRVIGPSPSPSSPSPSS